MNGRFHHINNNNNNEELQLKHRNWMDEKIKLSKDLLKSEVYEFSQDYNNSTALLNLQNNMIQIKIFKEK